MILVQSILFNKNPQDAECLELVIVLSRSDVLPSGGVPPGSILELDICYPTDLWQLPDLFINISDVLIQKVASGQVARRDVFGGKEQRYRVKFQPTLPTSPPDLNRCLDSLLFL